MLFFSGFHIRTWLAVVFAMAIPVGDHAMCLMVGAIDGREDSENVVDLRVLNV